jgi:hypothetical protein
MPLAVLASALIAIMACISVLAQGDPSREAPVGHRQPKAIEGPQEQQALSIRSSANRFVWRHQRSRSGSNGQPQIRGKSLIVGGFHLDDEVIRSDGDYAMMGSRHGKGRPSFHGRP